MNSTQNGKLKGTLYVLLCVALWALIPVVAKLGQTSLDNHQFLFWSSLVSFLILLISTVLTGKSAVFKKIKPGEYVWFALLGLLGTYIYYLFLYFGYAEAEGLEVLVVQYTWPVFIVILSLLILRESLSFRKVISIVLGFSGVLIVITKGNLKDIHFDNVKVLALVAAGSFCFALFSVLGKSVKKDALPVNTLYFLAAAAASFISMLFFSGFKLPGLQDWIPILLNGILVNGFSYVFWIRALHSTSASYLAPFTFLTPALSAVYLVLFFKAPFEASQAVGLFLVILAGLVNSLRLSWGKRYSENTVTK